MDKARRIIIVVWKWVPEMLTKGNVWRVEGSPNDFMYCVTQGSDVKYTDVIQGIMDEHNAEKCQVCVFLHRAASFNPDRVKTLLIQLKNTGDIKCFLFGAGDGYIYFKHERGILGKGGKIKQEVRANLEIQELKKKYFNDVWQHYDSLFKRKVFEFREALIGIFLYPKFKREDTITGSELFGYIKENRLIHTRFNSFTGSLTDDINDKIYRKRKKAVYLSDLKQFECDEGRYFDFNPILMHLDFYEAVGTKEKYELVKEKLLNFMNTGKEKTINAYDYLDEVNTLLQDLEKSLPGEVYE